MVVLWVHTPANEGNRLCSFIFVFYQHLSWQAPSFIDVRKYCLSGNIYRVGLITRFQYSEQSNMAHILHHRIWLCIKCYISPSLLTDLHGLRRLVSPWSLLDCTLLSILCWADLDVYLLYGNVGGKTKQNINLGFKY